MGDYPKFFDAYISKAENDGRILDDELEELNSNIDSKLYAQLFKFIIQKN